MKRFVAALVCLQLVACERGENNTPPTIAVGTYAVDEDQSLTGMVTLSDPDGDALSLTLSQSPTNGTASGLTASGSFIYTPNANFNGTDTFSLTVSDSRGGSASAVVTVTVRAVNDAPVVSTTNFAVDEDATLSARLGVTDPDGGVAAIALLANVSQGTLIGPSADGAFTYAPRANFNGADSFQVRVTDADGAGVSATVSFVVRPVNDAPVASADSARTPPGRPVTVAVLANDSDIDDVALRPEIVGAPADGSASVNSDGTVTFVPAAGFAGSTSFSYRAIDAAGAVSPSAALTIDVRPIQRVVFLSAAGPNQRVVLDDSINTRSLSAPLRANGRVLHLQVSKNAATAFWITTSSVVGVGFETFRASLSASAASEQLFGLPASSNFSSPKLSSDGNRAVVPRDGIVILGGLTLASTEGVLADLSAPRDGILATPPGLTSLQARYWEFANADRELIWVGNEPTRFDRSAGLFRTVLAAPGAAQQLTPAYDPGDSISTTLRISADGRRIVYVGSKANGDRAGVYLVDTTNPGTEILLGPQTSRAAGNAIETFDVDSRMLRAVWSTRIPFTPPNAAPEAFFADLNNAGNAVRIGSGFAVGTFLGAPMFSPDGNRIVLSVFQGNQSALYEVAVTAPAVLTRISPIYVSPAGIGRYGHTLDGRGVIYTAVADISGRADLWYVSAAQPGVAQRLNSLTSTSVRSDTFAFSPDGSTVAYGQPEAAGGPDALWMVDVTTPGRPLRIASDVVTFPPDGGPAIVMLP
jgi:VCBS repeat-containing protein